MINYKLIKGVAKSTDEIEQDFVYFCFKGIKIDGHEFIDAAFLKGAKYVIGTKKFGELENYFVIDDIEEEFKKASYNVYHFNLNKISSIGITGTNGKTSTAIILDQLLNKFDSCAYIGTSGFTIKQKKVNYNGMTTPFCNILYKNMEEITNQRCNYLAIEISSHALVQNRIGNLELDFAIFTNLSKEHLDFHKNMENYFESKKKIISHLSPNGKVIVNSDEE
ncbi:MAG: hypothetical protein JJV90_01375, partial [Spiroplasma sp.]|nr:hypothetical protein [Mycoplasmatales bacterium]